MCYQTCKCINGSQAHLYHGLNATRACRKPTGDISAFINDHRHLLALAVKGHAVGAAVRQPLHLVHPLAARNVRGAHLTGGKCGE